MIEAVERRADIEDKACYFHRLAVLDCSLDLFGKGGKRLCKVDLKLVCLIALGKCFCLSELFELVKALVDSLGKPLKKLLHRTVIARLRINVVCGGEDAAQAALNFGKMNILVGNILGWTDVYFTLKKPDDIHIDVDFRREDTAAEISFTARLSVFAALAFLLKAFGRAVGHYRKSPSLRRTIEKLRATPHN